MDPWLYNNRQVDYPQFIQSLVQQQAATNPIIQYNNDQRAQPPNIATSFTPKPAHLPLNSNWQQTSESNQIRSSFEPYQTLAAAGTNQIFTNPTYALQQTLNLAAAAAAVQPKTEPASNQNSLYRSVDSQSTNNKPAVNNQTSGTSSPNSNTNHVKQDNMYNLNRNFDKSRIVNPANSGNPETNFEVPFTPAKTYNNPQSQFFLIQQEQERKATEARQEHEQPLYLYRSTPAMTIFNTARNILAANNVAADRVKIETPYGGTVPQNDVSNSVVITRRPSPAQSNNSQISSPVYPPYNSPMNSVDSPSQNSTGSSQPSDNAGHIVIYKTNQQQAHQQASVSSPIVYPYPVITHNRTHDAYSAAAPSIIKPQYNNSQSTQIGALHNQQKESAVNQVTENIVVSTQCPLASQIQFKINNQQTQHQQHQQQHQQQQQQQQQQQTVVETPPAQPTPATKGRRRKPVAKAQPQQQQQTQTQQQQQNQQQTTNGVTQAVNNTPLQLFNNQLAFTNTQLQKQQQQAMMSALLPPYALQMPDIHGHHSGKDSSNDDDDEPKPKVVLQSIEDEFPDVNIKLPKPEKMQKNTNGATFIDSYLKFLDEQTAPAQPTPSAGGGRKASQKPIVTNVQIVSNTLQPQNLNNSLGGLDTAGGSGMHDEYDNLDAKKPKWRRKKSTSSTSNYDNNQVDQQQEEEVYRSQLPKKACPQIATQMPTAATSSAYAASAFQQNIQMNPQMQMQPSHPWSNLNPGNPMMNMMQNAFQQPTQYTQNNLTPSHPQQYRHLSEETATPPPRRQQSTRKAKSRGIEDLIATSTGDNDEDGFADSDCDPVWTPQGEEEYQDEEPAPSKRKPRKPKSTTRCKQRANILSAAVLGAGILDDGDDDEYEETNKPKRQTVVKVSDKFNVSDFVILTSEQFSKTPVLWQIESKAILQKYEPFMESGTLFYRSKQMFSTWRSNNVENYTKVQVTKCFQNGEEKVVKLILSPAQLANAEFTDKIMNEYMQFGDHFRVYVQALISQSLHSDFLSDVGDDDDFFHPNIAVIDGNIEQCRQKVVASLKWPTRVTAAIETWPVYREISEMEIDKYQCAICGDLAGITFSLSGDVYDRKTMKCAAYYPPAASYNKNITMCHKCITHAESLHKIVHTKYNLLQLCSKRVHDLLENAKDPHEILRELLTDSGWISELFANVRGHWTEAHNIERLSQLNELMGMLPQLQ